MMPGNMYYVTVCVCAPHRDLGMMPGNMYYVTVCVCAPHRDLGMMPGNTYYVTVCVCAPHRDLGMMPGNTYYVTVCVCAPHRDLGMMPEAEELLSDICRFYSEDQWLELSAPSYALLADCQRSLGLEDQYPSILVFGV